MKKNNHELLDIKYNHLFNWGHPNIRCTVFIINSNKEEEQYQFTFGGYWFALFQKIYKMKKIIELEDSSDYFPLREKMVSEFKRWALLK